MNKEQKDFLRELVDNPSPSGYEEPVAKVWRKRLEGIAQRIYGDLHGNSIAVINDEKKPKIMIAGHCDEIGLMINYIDEQGFLYFRSVGGYDRHILPGSRVKIWTKEGGILGVIGRKAIHFLEEEEKNKVAKLENMWIDIGAKNKKEAEEIVSIGDVATIDCYFEELKTGPFIARGFDDRIGAFVAAETLVELKKRNVKNAVYAVATVQEEVGLRGATTSTYHINPDIGFAVDVEFTSDHPDTNKRILGDVKLGEGPVVLRGANINPRLFELIIKTAKEENIKIQIMASPRGTGTDANIMQLTRGGVATAVIGIPNRYMHTPVEMIHPDDVDGAIKLLTEVILRIKNREDFVI
uniref:M42 family peptidase n=1 Tax=candidate division WOR-3 bacterium TaxID=2052148 RepID=A0A7C4UH28_UNCW3